MVNDRAFISRAEEIAAEGPGYEKGHDGSDHLCDCIGLIIGAIRRAGGQWRGLHGSNYAARRELTGKPQKIVGTGDLKPGELVFKAYEPGQGGYDLPARYEPGGEYYNGDLRDYYHVGIVVSAYPLQIRHMTSPKPKMDTSIGKWAWHGWCKKITQGEEMEETKFVYAGSGSTVYLRKKPSQNSDYICRVPIGSLVKVAASYDTGWSCVLYNGKSGYMMSKFLVDDIPEADTGQTEDPTEETKSSTDLIWAELNRASDAIERAKLLMQQAEQR